MNLWALYFSVVLVMPSNISSYFHVLISLGSLLTSLSRLKGTDGTFSHHFRKSIHFFYKGPEYNCFRVICVTYGFCGRLFCFVFCFGWYVVCPFTCFTAFGTYEKHSQLTGHAWLIHEPHSHFWAQPHVGEGWHSGTVCHQGWSSDLGLSRTHRVEEESQLLKIILWPLSMCQHTGSHIQIDKCNHSKKFFLSETCTKGCH